MAAEWYEHQNYNGGIWDGTNSIGAMQRGGITGRCEATTTTLMHCTFTKRALDYVEYKESYVPLTEDET
ncbi:hypothetical protein PsorP6_007627 [Peronosclerospora sorghi]|uniref:Uncharacterized protein n=1 Tax=Peronosclerospora sorghi TaxID=230839 RepID=A0ACC0W6F4_9STRA|nr:hypothetical protein PsorP6_007627 [Peronosclerospora sorghi]